MVIMDDVSPVEHTARVYQASGMVSVQADCSIDDALALMREHATSSHRSLDDVAQQIVERRIRLA
jgi:AmiR/NasT family two-component response regulator